MCVCVCVCMSERVYTGKLASVCGGGCSGDGGGGVCVWGEGDSEK